MKTPNILIINRHPRLRTSLPFLKTSSSSILDFLDLSETSVEITLCSDSFMRRENKKHMGRHTTTDVLSFPQIPPQKKRSAYQNRFLGDILISLDQASRQASEQNLSLRQEVFFLIIHSVLHLIGYDHATKPDRLKMQKLESEIWLFFKGSFLAISRRS